MDLLSDALAAVRMTGAIFFNVECREPWGFSVPATGAVAHLLAPGTRRLVNYHLVLEGDATVRIDGVDELRAGPGDIVVLPHGDAHAVTGSMPAALVDAKPPIDEVLSGRPRTVRFGGSGRPTSIICGFLGCERQADRLFLGGLPPVFSVNLRNQETAQWLEQSVRYLVAEAEAQRPGASALLSRMAEALFVETLRARMNEGADDIGWLAGARDPIVGGALAAIHREPARAWTVVQLAAEVGTSRSVLGERFARYLDEAPLEYLTRWRLQLGARQLRTSSSSVLEIAVGVGYQSESGFNRAFKRQFGVPPGRFRQNIHPDE